VVVVQKAEAGEKAPVDNDFIFLGVGCMDGDPGTAWVGIPGCRVIGE